MFSPWRPIQLHHQTKLQKLSLIRQVTTAANNLIPVQGREMLKVLFVACCSVVGLTC
jgi:hypothetical protein